MNFKKKYLPALAVVILALILAGCGAGEKTPEKVKAFFPERHGWDLKKIVISDGDRSLLFKREKCIWVIGPDSLTSDEARVTDLADKLVRLQPKVLVAENESEHSGLRVSAQRFDRKITLIFKDGQSGILLFGRSPRAGLINARLIGEATVYGVDEPALQDIVIDGAAWLEPGAKEPEGQQPEKS